MALGWIPSLAFVVLFSFLFVRDYRFWRDMKKWDFVKRTESVPIIVEGKLVDWRTLEPEKAKEYSRRYGGGALLEIAEHNLITSIIGMIISAVIMAVDVCLIVGG
jgi:hypothetical protein